MSQVEFKLSRKGPNLRVRQEKTAGMETGGS